MEWLFAEYEEFDAATNMAIDEALLDRHLAGLMPPVVRLYGFAPPAVTLGYAQRPDESVLQRISERGFGCARRPTGGRAVLHYKDLTYAFIGSQAGSGPWGTLAASVSAAYAQICEGLKQSLSLLGAQVELGETQAAYRHLTDCFLATTPADLHYRGRKIAGSAQLRRSGAVLQHGSIPLDQEQDLMAELLGSEPPPAASRHANLFEVLNRRVDWEEFNTAFSEGFSTAFNQRFCRTKVSEQAGIDQLLADSGRAEPVRSLHG